MSRSTRALPAPPPANPRPRVALAPRLALAALLLPWLGGWLGGDVLSGCGGHASSPQAPDVTIGTIGDGPQGPLQCGPLTLVTPAEGALAGQPLCVGVVEAGAAAGPCPAAAPTRVDAGPFFACFPAEAPATPSPEALAPALDAACAAAGGTGARAVVAGGEPYCVVADAPADGPGCPALLPHGTPWRQLLVCGRGAAPTEDAAHDAVSAGCAGGTVVAPASGPGGCVFITETGFDCPPFLAGRVDVGDWAVCGPASLGDQEARALAAATCDGGGVFAVTGAEAAATRAGCVFITETGFACPPHAQTAVTLGDTGVCGGAGLDAAAATRVASAYCGGEAGGAGPAAFVQAGSLGVCATAITETGFQPCPMLHPAQRGAQPFGLCSAQPLDKGAAALARREVCGDAKRLLDFQADTVCAYAITETGFLCPSLLPSAIVPEGGGATICAAGPSLPAAAIQAAAAYAAAPRVCPWTVGVDAAYRNGLGGADATVRGLFLTGSMSDTVPLALPDGVSLSTDKMAAHYAAHLNLDGTVAMARVLADSNNDVAACGHAVGDDGSVTIAGHGFGVATFHDATGEARVVTLGDDALYVARYDVFGVLQWVATRPVQGYDLRGCAVSVAPDGTAAVASYTTVAELAAPGMVGVLDADGGWVWAQDALPTDLSGVVAHPGGAATVAGTFQGAWSLPQPGGPPLAFQPGTGRDGFLVRLDDGGAPVWGRILRDTSAGPSYDDSLTDVQRAGRGDVLVSGWVEMVSEVVDADGGAVLVALPDQDPDSGYLRDSVVLRVDADGGMAWALRALGHGTNEARGLTLGLDGAVHVSGRLVGDVDFGALAGGETLTLHQDGLATLGFVGMYALRLDADTGAVLSGVEVSGADVYAERDHVIGHLDGATTVVAEYLGAGDFGVEAARVHLDKGTYNAGIAILHTGPAGGCGP